VRPMNSRMDCEKLSRILKFEMPDWQDATAQVMRDVLAEKLA
jgi:dTDP-4-dehydrorhamnose reductase